jgi:type IV secretory pathway ATPase VirB11/archaellum biosynthesis ATPase
MADLTIAELVRNGTMSAEIAALLWAAVDEQVSFLTVAVPRLAGKSTTSEAVLALRRPDVPLHRVAGEPELMERLKQEQRGGYLVVGEFSQAPVPGYIWGPPVHRVFDTLSAGYSLQTCLHAPGPEAAVQEVTLGNGIGDEQASVLKLIIYIERFGTDMSNFWRRISQVYELHKVENGAAIGHPLFRWHSDGDRFEKLMDAHQFARDHADLERRAALIGELAASGRTSTADVEAAVSDYRARD